MGRGGRLDQCTFVSCRNNAKNASLQKVLAFREDLVDFFFVWHQFLEMSVQGTEELVPNFFLLFVRELWEYTFNSLGRCCMTFSSQLDAKESINCPSKQSRTRRLCSVATFQVLCSPVANRSERIASRLPWHSFRAPSTDRAFADTEKLADLRERLRELLIGRRAKNARCGMQPQRVN